MTSVRGSQRWIEISLWLIVGVVGACVVAPLAWIVVQAARAVIDARFDFLIDPRYLQSLTRTIVLNTSAAALACMFASPLALAMGLTRGRSARLLWVFVPVTILLPSVVLGYGFSQLLQWMGITPQPAGPLDKARCVVTLASWLLPVPAVLTGLWLRRIDGAILDAARVDGALPRVLARIMLAPMSIGFSVALLLALQELAVYEPTGIDVIATQSRLIFETGSTSWRGGVSIDSGSRAALAVLSGLPMVLTTLGLCGACVLIARRWTNDLEGVAVQVPAVGRSPMLHVLAWTSVALASVLPLGALASSLDDLSIPRIWGEFGQKLTASLTLATMATLVAAGAGVAMVVGIGRPLLWLAIACFLINAQMLAIALIHLLNRPGLDLVYDSWGVGVVAYVARFGWIVLLAAIATWHGTSRSLRVLARADGATRWQSARFVVLPIAAPTLVASAVLMLTLSATEVPATLMLQPEGTLVPLLMTFAHTLNDQAMIEACLLLTGLVLSGWIVILSIRRLWR